MVKQSTDNASRAAKLRKGKYAASSASSIGGGAGGACTSRHSVHPVSTPKYAATGQIRKSGSMSSLSEHGGTGVDLQNFPQRSLRSVPSDDRGRLSPTPHVREVGNESSGIGLSVPDTAIDAPSSSRQPSKRESAGTFSLFNTLSDRISAAGWAWYGGSERVCVSPLKTDDSSMEDIEADTFRGSVRRKPVNSNLIKHPAEASLRGITTNVSSGEPHSDPSREEVETSATVRTDTDNNLTAATETATDTVTATAATSFAEGGTSPSAATAE